MVVRRRCILGTGCIMAMFGVSTSAWGLVFKNAVSGVGATIYAMIKYRDLPVPGGTSHAARGPGRRDAAFSSIAGESPTVCASSGRLPSLDDAAPAAAVGCVANAVATAKWGMNSTRRRFRSRKLRGLIAAWPERLVATIGSKMALPGVAATGDAVVLL